MFAEIVEFPDGISNSEALADGVSTATLEWDGAEGPPSTIPLLGKDTDCWDSDPKEGHIV